ncbi:MAG: CobW family GTP-binding protein [Oligoflexus sp.]|jgi:G3E family GTPase
METEANRIPVTIVTGYLGSGKTTLLNRILTEHHGRRIAVIENEFGEIGIDSELVTNADEEIFEMNNGCICCTVRGDLIRIIGRLMQRRDRFDAILIETTGLADPAPVIQTFFVDEDIRANVRLDAVVTVVDSHHVLQHWDEAHEVQEQIAFADVILLNKIDLVDESRQADLTRKIRAINASVTIHPTVKSQVSVDAVMGLGAFELDRALAIDPNFLTEDAHEHDETIGSVGFEIQGELNGGRAQNWLSRLLRDQGQNIFRMKGVLAIEGETERMVLQGVHMLMNAAPGQAWRESEVRKSKLIFIGRQLDRQGLEKGLKECLA